MHHAKVIKVQPKRERLEPLHVVGALVVGELIEELMMLSVVLIAVCPQMTPAARRILGRVADCIEFVVAHDDLGAATVDHALDDLEGTQLLTAAVHQIADEDCAPLRMPKGAGPMLIAEFSQQGLQGGSATMDVTDDVVTLHDPIFAFGLRAV